MFPSACIVLPEVASSGRHRQTEVCRTTGTIATGWGPLPSGKRSSPNSSGLLPWKSLGEPQSFKVVKRQLLSKNW